jgi:hypothetical protein
MKSNPMQVVIIGVVAGSIMWLSGCAIYDAAIVGLHDSLDEMKAGQTNKPSVVVTPPADKPVAGALVCPLSYLGDEATVDGILSRGELPESDNRSPYKFQLIRPSGKCWSFANFVEAGLVRDGKVFAGAWKGQHYTPVYQSEHDQGVHMPGHPLADGATLGGERFIYFECRELKQ